MRLCLYIACCGFLAALLLAAAAPAGLNLCIQSTGKASVGLSCSCDHCAAQSAVDKSDAGLNCCQRCEGGPALHSRCCTCTKLPAMASAIATGPDKRPKAGELPLLKPPARFDVTLLASGEAYRLGAQPHPPPLLSRTIVLRL